MPATFNAAQLRTLYERIESVDRAMAHFRQWVHSGSFNAYGVAPSQRLIFPFRIETGEDPYQARRRVSAILQGCYPTSKRLTSIAAIGEIVKLAAEGYRMVDSVEEVALILAENGDVE